MTTRSHTIRGAWAAPIELIRSKARSALHRVAADQSGFTLIELMAAVLVLTIGVVALLSSFDSSRSLATSAEMRDTATAQAEKQIQMISSQKWAQMALSASPGTRLTATPNDPDYYVSTGTCDTSVNLPTHSPCYQWDWNDTTKVEPLVVCSQPSDPGCTATGLDSATTTWSAPVSGSNSNVRLSGSIYSYITWVNDPDCSGPTCGGSNAYKRITIGVTVNGLPKAIWQSTVVQNGAGGTSNPLNSSSTKCKDVDGTTTVTCVN